MTKENDMTQQASETMHPTDDELEAMAAKLDRKTPNMIEGHAQMEDAATMLRACKGGAGVDAHTVASEVFKAIAWGSQITPPPHGAAYPSYTRYGNSAAETKARAIAARILSALEPAPDARQEGWRAGIEAAAAECDMLADIELSAAHESYAQGYSDGADNCASAIRALAEKGPDHD